MAAPPQGSVSALFALIPVSPASHMYVYPYQDIQEGTAGVHASVAAASVPIPVCPPSHQGWLNVPQTWAFLLAIQSVPSARAGTQHFLFRPHSNVTFHSLLVFKMWGKNVLV